MLLYLQIGIAIFALAVNVVVQIAFVRWVPGVGLLKSIFIGFGTGLIFLLGLETYFGFLFDVWDVSPPYMLMHTLTYCALGYCYFHFINLGQTARRIRILREMDDAGGVMTRDQLLQRYNANEMVEKRFSRLLRSGQVIEREDRLFIGNTTLLRMAQIMVLMKRLILGKTSEFD